VNTTRAPAKLNSALCIVPGSTIFTVHYCTHLRFQADREAGWCTVLTTSTFCSLCKAHTIIHCLPTSTCCLVDRHRFDADPDPDLDTDLDTDPDPIPSFTHVGKLKFFYLYSQQCQTG
jgi:hypothetical protein